MFGWEGHVSDFLAAELNEVVSALEQHARSGPGSAPSESQVRAWRNCVRVLQDQLTAVASLAPHFPDWSIVFEYELPRERGRRPDVVLLGATTIIVLEFKDFAEVLPQHVDQVAAYAQDLRHYHSECHDRLVVPALVLTHAKSTLISADAVEIASGDRVGELLARLAAIDASTSLINCARWLAGEYSPLPTLVDAARRIFEHEPLPAIRRAQSAGIPWTLKYLDELAQRARDQSERHLAIITGVPGAGKTLVGLQFVYQRHFSGNGNEKHAVFLSGNGPLVKVLQHALKSSVFVQDVHGFLRQYGGTSTQLPREHIWIYDEAQRAWDAERVSQKRGHTTSEPEDFLSIGTRVDRWALMIGLVGQGQEIHLGEEAGLGQWNDAISAAGGEWTVHCAPRIAPVFTAATHVESAPVLDLTQSLRSHIAEDVQRWIDAVLEGHLLQAAALAKRVESQGFHIYITQDLEHAKAYVRDRYAGQLDKRYGLLASSKGKNLPEFGVRNDYGFTKNFREGPWYNDPPDSKFSCCQLKDVATEFASQGLELDMPIVCWGSDMQFEAGSWKTPRVTARNRARNPKQLRLNSYRVLLSRGRDGLVLFVPKQPAAEQSFAALVEAGARLLRPTAADPIPTGTAATYQ
jgi:DUF2075 family protein